MSTSTLKNRILIAYASYGGSTAEVARAIGESLGEQGFIVDVKPIAERPEVGEYQAILIGSAVQYARWLPEAVDFVKGNQEALKRRPVALFCVHIQNLGADEASRKNRLAYLDDVRPSVRPLSEGFFAGKFDRRGAALLLPGFLARVMPPIDLRKWKKIQVWAESTGQLLQTELQESKAYRPAPDALIGV
jgi:menaquinone-dependent protoporphyrinogen oxidase